VLSEHPSFVLIALIILAALLVIRHVLCTGPRGLPHVIPRRLRRPAQVAWRERPFLGWGRNWLGLSRWAFGGAEDAVAIVGPPRVGKTAGILIPQAAMWRGPLITTSTRPEVLRATAARRLALGRQHGGGIYVYAPLEGGRVEALEPLHWSPLAGCQDPRVAVLRVQSMVTVAEVGKGMENADHWRAGAGRILRPYFLAAAHHQQRPGDFAVVREWLSLQEFREPLAILSGLGTVAGYQWAADLNGVAATPDRERGSFFSAAINTVRVTADPTVLQSCSRTDLDPVEFLTTSSTLYIISPTEHQEAVAPLVAALIESIVNAAYGLHAASRLSSRLLLCLDEVANIAPLPGLESIASQGAGSGVNLAWGAQSMAQMRSRYGADGAQAIWSSSRCRLVFGGLADTPGLDELSRLIGDHRVRTRSRSVSNDGQQHRTWSHEWRPRLSPAELRQLPDDWAVLLYHNRPPYALRAPIAARRRRMRPAFLPWPVAAPGPVPPALQLDTASVTEDEVI
jgi:type IV secretion system protein VirD4